MISSPGLELGWGGLGLATLTLVVTSAPSLASLDHRRLTSAGFMSGFTSGFCSVLTSIFVVLFVDSGFVIVLDPDSVFFLRSGSAEEARDKSKYNNFIV